MARFVAAQRPGIVRKACCGCVRRPSDPEFVGALERRLLTAARDATDRLAEIALASNRPDVALALVRVTLNYDPCDERARELAIRAHVARGDRANAIREYRDYTKALLDELGLTPAFELAPLIGSRAKAM